jgi:hypothetical protein
LENRGREQRGRCCSQPALACSLCGFVGTTSAQPPVSATARSFANPPSVACTPTRLTELRPRRRRRRRRRIHRGCPTTRPRAAAAAAHAATPGYACLGTRPHRCRHRRCRLHADRRRRLGAWAPSGHPSGPASSTTCRAGPATATMVAESGGGFDLGRGEEPEPVSSRGIQ